MLDGARSNVVEHLVQAGCPAPAIARASSKSATSKLLTPHERILPSRTSVTNAPMVSAKGMLPRQYSR